MLRVALLLLPACDALRSSAAPVKISRRAFGSGIAIAAPLALETAPAFAAPAVAAPIVDAAPPRPVLPSATLPSWTMLIPMIEADDAVKAWTTDAQKGFGFTAKAGLEAFTKGGLLSAKNFYLGVGTKYATSIAYDDFDKKLVEEDKNARIGAVVFGGQAIDAARKASKVDDGAAAAEALKVASSRFGEFFARVPAADIERARNAIVHLKAAYTSKDGIINDDEFYAAPLSEEERLAATWGVWGTTLYSEDLRSAVGSSFVLRTKAPEVPDRLKKVIASSEF
jgi:hypothetical protein